MTKTWMNRSHSSSQRRGLIRRSYQRRRCLLTTSGQRNLTRWWTNSRITSPTVDPSWTIPEWLLLAKQSLVSRNPHQTNPSLPDTIVNIPTLLLKNLLNTPLQRKKVASSSSLFRKPSPKGTTWEKDLTLASFLNSRITQSSRCLTQRGIRNPRSSY